MYERSHILKFLYSRKNFHKISSACIFCNILSLIMAIFKDVYFIYHNINNVEITQKDILNKVKMHKGVLGLSDIFYLDIKEVLYENKFFIFQTPRNAQKQIEFSLNNYYELIGKNGTISRAKKYLAKYILKHNNKQS